MPPRMSKGCVHLVFGGITGTELGLVWGEPHKCLSNDNLRRVLGYCSFSCKLPSCLQLCLAFCVNPAVTYTQIQWAHSPLPFKSVQEEFPSWRSG